MKSKAMKAMKMKAMKMKAMKAMKAMKKKRVSKIARGTRARSSVFNGNKEKTISGMTKDKLMKNKFGKIVSKAQSARAKSRYSRSVKFWADAVKAARKALGLKGFVAIGGSSASGKALYAKAKSLCA